MARVAGGYPPGRSSLGPPSHVPLNDGNGAMPPGGWQAALDRAFENRPPQMTRPAGAVPLSPPPSGPQGGPSTPRISGGRQT